MRAYTIALYLFIFNMLVSLLTGTALFGTAMGGAVEWDKNVSGNMTFNSSGINGTLSILPVDYNFTEQTNFSGYKPGGMTEFNFFDGIYMLAMALWRSTIYLPWFLGELGFPSSIYYPLAMGVWFVYAAGVIQFLTGRGTKTYD